MREEKSIIGAIFLRLFWFQQEPDHFLEDLLDFPFVKSVLVDDIFQPSLFTFLGDNPLPTEPAHVFHDLVDDPLPAEPAHFLIDCREGFLAVGQLVSHLVINRFNNLDLSFETFGSKD